MKPIISNEYVEALRPYFEKEGYNEIDITGMRLYVGNAAKQALIYSIQLVDYISMDSGEQLTAVNFYTLNDEGGGYMKLSPTEKAYETLIKVVLDNLSDN